MDEGNSMPMDGSMTGMRNFMTGIKNFFEMLGNDDSERWKWKMLRVSIPQVLRVVDGNSVLAMSLSHTIE